MRAIWLHYLYPHNPPSDMGNLQSFAFPNSLVYFNFEGHWWPLLETYTGLKETKYIFLTKCCPSEGELWGKNAISTQVLNGRLFSRGLFLPQVFRYSPCFWYHQKVFHHGYTLVPLPSFQCVFILTCLPHFILVPGDVPLSCITWSSAAPLVFHAWYHNVTSCLLMVIPLSNLNWFPAFYGMQQSTSL
jgi:hypothetical protein